MPKPTDEDRDRFRSLLPTDPRVEVKPMFGQLGAFVNGNMFAGLFGTDVGVKLSDDDREELLAAGGTPFGPAERPMAGYLTLPRGAAGHPAAAGAWMTRAFDHVAAMPPKARKKAAPRKATKARGQG